MHSRVGSVAQLLFVDIVGSVVWFPVWWYTTGLTKVVNAAIRAMRYRAQAYAFVVWIRNFFVPMYGQYDWEGRIISVVMRTVVLIFRLIAFAIESLIYMAGILAWCVIPPLAVIIAFENGVMSMVPRSAIR